jgi:hypothetical protein
VATRSERQVSAQRIALLQQRTTQQQRSALQQVGGQQAKVKVRAGLVYSEGRLGNLSHVAPSFWWWLVILCARGL